MSKLSDFFYTLPRELNLVPSSGEVCRSDDSFFIYFAATGIQTYELLSRL